jgi:hypothetical protein
VFVYWYRAVSCRFYLIYSTYHSSVWRTLFICTLCHSMEWRKLNEHAKFKSETQTEIQRPQKEFCYVTDKDCYHPKSRQQFVPKQSSLESRDSSVGIALGYRLDDRDSRVRFPTRARNFSLHYRVQNGSGAHPASYPMGTRGSFPRGKAAGA